MPETLQSRERKFSRNLNQTKYSKLTIDELCKTSGVEFVGSGAECVVIKTKNSGDHRVTAFRYSEISPEKAKSIFYLQRIFSTLFPHNFPRFYSSFAQDEGKKINAGTIRQRIHNPIKKADFLQTSEEDDKYPPKIKYPFETAKYVIYDFINRPCFDLFRDNFGIGPDGGEYYLDTPLVNSNMKLLPEKIIDYMSSNPRQDGKKYTENDFRMIISSVVRLNKLGIVSTD